MDESEQSKNGSGLTPSPTSADLEAGESQTTGSEASDATAPREETAPRTTESTPRAIPPTGKQHVEESATTQQQPKPREPKKPPIELRLRSEQTCKWLVAIQLALTLALALALVIGGMKPPEDRIVLLWLSMFYSTVIFTVVGAVALWKRLLAGPWKRVATQVLPYVEFALGLLATYSILVQMEATTYEFVARLALVIAPFPLFLIYQLRKDYARSMGASGANDEDDIVDAIDTAGVAAESNRYSSALDTEGNDNNPADVSKSDSHDDTQEPVWRRVLFTFLLVISAAAYITGIVLL